MATPTLIIPRNSATLAADGAPIANDSIYLLGGGIDITTALDQSGITGLTDFEVPSEFTAQLGSVAGPLKARIVDTFWYNAGGGDCYWHSDGSASDTSAILRVVGNGHMHQNFGLVTHAHTRSGHYTVGTGGAFTNGYFMGGSVKVLDDSSVDPTNIYVNGAKVEFERASTIFDIASGQVTLRAGTNTQGTIRLGNGSSLALQESGTITALYAIGSIPNISGLARPLTITDCWVNISLPGAQAFLDATALITFTNAPTRLGTDGRS